MEECQNFLGFSWTVLSLDYMEFIINQLWTVSVDQRGSAAFYLLICAPHPLFVSKMPLSGQPHQKNLHPCYLVNVTLWPHISLTSNIWAFSWCPSEWGQVCLSAALQTLEVSAVTMKHKATIKEEKIPKEENTSKRKSRKVFLSSQSKNTFIVVFLFCFASHTFIKPTQVPFKFLSGVSQR